MIDKRNPTIIEKAVSGPVSHIRCDDQTAAGVVRATLREIEAANDFESFGQGPVITIRVVTADSFLRHSRAAERYRYCGTKQNKLPHAYLPGIDDCLNDRCSDAFAAA